MPSVLQMAVGKTCFTSVIGHAQPPSSLASSCAYGPVYKSLEHSDNIKHLAVDRSVQLRGIQAPCNVLRPLMLAIQATITQVGKLKPQVPSLSQQSKPSIQAICQAHFAHQTSVTASSHRPHTLLGSGLQGTMWYSHPHSTKHRNVHVLVSATDNRNDGEHRISLLPEAEVITEELRHGPQGQSGLDRRKDLCDSGLPDVDMCELSEGPDSTGSRSLDEAISRGKWLLGLLVVQSTSSFVLDAYQDLLRDHLVVTLFLTMLVGAGGNAGNQSSIKVIRGLATGSISPSWQSAKNTLAQQASVGLLLGTGLSLGGFARVYLTNGNLINALAISISLFAIVMTSVLLGTTLPFAMAQMGVDPANSGTSIQVLMDILGVAITCGTCHLVLVQFAAGLPA